MTETKTWSYFHLSDYRWWTYKQFKDVVSAAGSALVHVGCEPGKVFNIYSATTPRWQVMANGAPAASLFSLWRVTVKLIRASSCS